jgi:hypothetical protein
MNIKENYKAMTNQQLLQIADEDYNHLTSEAKSALLSELETRNIRQNGSDNSLPLTLTTTLPLSQLSKDSLAYILEQKEKGEPSIYIIGGLLERGYEEETAVQLLKELPSFIQNKIKEMSNFILTGVLLFTAGFSIKMLPLSKESHLAIIILANVLLGIGIIRFFHGFLNKKRFTIINKNILTEKSTLE